jgi:hypothetical protein
MLGGDVLRWWRPDCFNIGLTATKKFGKRVPPARDFLADSFFQRLAPRYRSPCDKTGFGSSA